MASHSSTLAWRIPWKEEPGRLQTMGSRRVRHNWATSFSLFTFMIGEGNGNPLQCSCLENPRDRGARWAAVYGVAQSRTRRKRLSSSSSICNRNMLIEAQKIFERIPNSFHWGMKLRVTEGLWAFAILFDQCFIPWFYLKKNPFIEKQT